MSTKGTRTVSRANYKQYITSNEWAKVKKRYWNSKLPKECYVCGVLEGKKDLHHRTYKNLGNERLMDLVPVHRECHFDIHDFQKKTKKDLWKSTSVMRKKHRSKGRF